MNPQQIGSRLKAVLKHSTLALAVAAGLTAGSAQAQLTYSVTGNGTNGLVEWGGEADGYRFTTGASQVAVSWLGFYDAPTGESGSVGDDLVASHRVSIWRESDQALMAQTTVQPGDTLEGSFRGRDVTPVILDPFTAYVIAADYGGEGDRLQSGNDLSGWGLNGITIDDGRYGGAGGGMASSGWEIMISANFGYELAALSVTLTSPAAGEGYPSGSFITASANVVEPGDFADTVTFHVTPVDPPGAPLAPLVSSDIDSPFTADLGILPDGTYEIYASVANDDVPPGTDSSPVHAFTVAAAIPTTTVLAPAGAPTTYGDNVSFTATVTPVPSGGTVQFFDGASYLGDPVAVDTGTGQAIYSTTTLGAGSREITAQFSGHWLHETSITAASISQEVGQAQLTVKALNTLRAPGAANPSPFPYQTTGYQNGENLASSGVTGEPELTTVADPMSDPGDYEVTCAIGTLGSSNYSFALVNGTLTVAVVVDTFSVNFYAYPGWMTDEGQQANIRVPDGVPAGYDDWYTSGWLNVEVPFGLDSPMDPIALTSNQGSSATFLFNDCRNGWVYDDVRTVGLGDGNYNMMDGHVNSTLDYDLDTQSPGDNYFEMEVNGIPFDSYDVIFYIGGNLPQFGDGTGVIVFNGGAPRAFTVKPGAFDGTFTEMVDAGTLGNYIVFTGVTGSSFTTQTWGTGENGFNHIGPFGFQIRESSGATGYSAWAALHAGGAEALPGDDFNNDSVQNGIAYFMGEDGIATNPGPVDGTVTWPYVNAVSSYKVQTSIDLTPEGWTDVLPDDPRLIDTGLGGSVSYNLLPYDPDTLYVRLVVTP